MMVIGLLHNQVEKKLFVVCMMYGIGVMIRLLTQMYLLGEIQILYVRQIKLIMSHEIIEL